MHSPRMGRWKITLFIVYAVDHIRTARHELRDLHEIDSDWDIFTCLVESNHASERL